MTCSQKAGFLLLFAMLLPCAFLAGADQTVDFQKQTDSVEVLIGGRPFTTILLWREFTQAVYVPLAHSARHRGDSRISYAHGYPRRAP